MNPDMPAMVLYYAGDIGTLSDKFAPPIVSALVDLNLSLDPTRTSTPNDVEFQRVTSIQFQHQPVNAFGVWSTPRHGMHGTIRSMMLFNDYLTVFAASAMAQSSNAISLWIGTDYLTEATIAAFGSFDFPDTHGVDPSSDDFGLVVNASSDLVSTFFVGLLGLYGAKGVVVAPIPSTFINVTFTEQVTPMPGTTPAVKNLEGSDVLNHFAVRLSDGTVQGPPPTTETFSPTNQGVANRIMARVPVRILIPETAFDFLFVWTSIANVPNVVPPDPAGLFGLVVLNGFADIVPRKPTAVVKGPVFFATQSAFTATYQIVLHDFDSPTVTWHEPVVVSETRDASVLAPGYEVFGLGSMGPVLYTFGNTGDPPFYVEAYPGDDSLVFEGQPMQPTIAPVHHVAHDTVQISVDPTRAWPNMFFRIDLTVVVQDMDGSAVTVTKSFLLLTFPLPIVPDPPAYIPPIQVLVTAAEVAKAFPWSMGHNDESDTTHSDTDSTVIA